MLYLCFRSQPCPHSCSRTAFHQLCTSLLTLSYQFFFHYLSVFKDAQISLILNKTLPDSYLPTMAIYQPVFPFEAKIYVPSVHLHFLIILCFLLIPADSLHTCMCLNSMENFQSVSLTCVKVDTEHSPSFLKCALDFHATLVTSQCPLQWQFLYIDIKCSKFLLKLGPRFSALLP